MDVDEPTQRLYDLSYALPSPTHSKNVSFATLPRSRPGATLGFRGPRSPRRRHHASSTPLFSPSTGKKTLSPKQKASLKYVSGSSFLGSLLRRPLHLKKTLNFKWILKTQKHQETGGVLRRGARSMGDLVQGQGYTGKKKEDEGESSDDEMDLGPWSRLQDNTDLDEAQYLTLPPLRSSGDMLPSNPFLTPLASPMSTKDYAFESSPSSSQVDTMSDRSFSQFSSRSAPSSCINNNHSRSRSAQSPPLAPLTNSNPQSSMCRRQMENTRQVMSRMKMLQLLGVEASGAVRAAEATWN